MEAIYLLEEDLINHVNYSPSLISISTEFNNDLIATKNTAGGKLYLNWIKLLVKDDTGNLTSFLNVYKEGMGLCDAIMTYRKNIRRIGEGVVDNLEVIREFENKNFSVVRDLLQEKSLEYISHHSFFEVLTRMEYNSISIESLLSQMDSFPNMRIMSFVV